MYLTQRPCNPKPISRNSWPNFNWTLIYAGSKRVPIGERTMQEYRAFTVGRDGHFNGFEPMTCANDNEAIKKATRLSAQYPVELWSGTRLVVRLPGPEGEAVRHEIHEGRMVPKSTS
jgi:hypothetical protein